MTIFRFAIDGVVLAAGMALWALPATLAGPAMAQHAEREPFACTRLPRTFWLPLTTLVERMTEGGATVHSALATSDDCYEVQLLQRDGRLKTIIFHPVSGKPLG